MDSKLIERQFRIDVDEFYNSFSSNVLSDIKGKTLKGQGFKIIPGKLSPYVSFEGVVTDILVEFGDEGDVVFDLKIDGEKYFNVDEWEIVE